MASQLSVDGAVGVRPASESGRALSLPGALKAAASLPVLLACFTGTFIACAVFFQVQSTIPPWVEAAPIEYFTGGLLWLLSFLAMLIASKNGHSGVRLLFWVCASMGLGALALDERFAEHEKTVELLGDDDYVKLAIVFSAGVALLIVNRLERPGRPIKLALAVGYIIQLLYLVVDLADGDMFSVPFLHGPMLPWIEEWLELTFLSIYFCAFVGLAPLRGSPGGAAADRA